MPRAFGLRDFRFQRGKVDAQLAHPAARADDETAPGDPAFDAAPGNRTHVQCRLERETLAATDTARASGCSLPVCSAAANASASFSSGLKTARTGFPTVSVPVLSNATGGSRCGFQGFRILDEDPVARLRLCRLSPSAGKPERTRAGDHEHRHRVEQCVLPISRRKTPSEQSHGGDGEHGGHEDGAHLVDEPLDRRLFRLRVLDKLDDVR